MIKILYLLASISSILSINITTTTTPTIKQGAAVLVETRYTPALLFVLDRAKIFVPHHWDIVLITNQRVAQEYKAAAGTFQLPTNDRKRNITIKILIPDTLDRNGYNALIKSRRLYDHDLLHYEWLIFFQTDTTFCRPFNLKDVIHQQQNQDLPQIAYIGSVWDSTLVSSSNGFACATLRDKSLKRAYIHVGNGGFSLRNRKVMIDVIDRWYSMSGHLPFNEDVWFACGAHYFGSLANVSTANSFSIESVPYLLDTKIYGVHKPWKYQSDVNLKRLVKACPSLRGLMQVNGIDRLVDKVPKVEVEGVDHDFDL